MREAKRMSDNKTAMETFDTCTALFPLCGSDLYHLETGCVCKNPKCNYSCDKCMKDDQP